MVVTFWVGVPDDVVYTVALIAGDIALGDANSTLYSTQREPGVEVAVHVTTVAKATASSR